MSSFSFRLPVGTSDFFSDLPKSAKHFLLEAFNIFARVHAHYSQLVVSIILESVASGVEPKAADLSTKFGLSENDGQAMVAAISFLVLILSRPAEPEPEPISTIIEGLSSSGILGPAAQSAVESVLNEIARDRQTITAAFRRSRVSSRLLPSFTHLSYVIDIRLDFDKDQVAVAVPVLLLHIDTDAEDEEIRLQMNRRQLEGTIEDLQKALSRLDAAEKWVQERRS